MNLRYWVELSQVGAAAAVISSDACCLLPTLRRQLMHWYSDTGKVWPADTAGVGIAVQETCMRSLADERVAQRVELGALGFGGM